MSDTNKFEVGAAVKVANLLGGNTSDWSWLIKDHTLVANRKANSTGKVVGYYYLPKNTIVCVVHDDGAAAAYDDGELNAAGAEPRD